MPGPMSPHRRTFVGVIVGVADVHDREHPARVTDVEARVAVYASRTSSEPLTDLPVRWPAAGTFKPTVGDRLRVTLEPVE